ncbi:hypothetical protein [Ahrensia marina]|uniref:Uncharacterized protein n=1 Tax=Ahrensia marina TaxID=1514904 RepID=A0A0N0E6F1_9HYPH|nr:hypothetical protein [Ahrensia marina]KPA99930.1 hypothetical protein SU32_16505 [Ahrensia marina]
MSLDDKTRANFKAPENDIIQIPFTCGAMGLPFRGIYKRNESGLYVQQRLERVMPHENPVDTCEDVAALAAELLIDESFVCPWCQAENKEAFYVRCGNCSTINCAASFTETTPKKYDFECVCCGLKRKDSAFGALDTLAVGEGGVTGQISGSVRQLQYFQAN